MNEPDGFIICAVSFETGKVTFPQHDDWPDVSIFKSPRLLAISVAVAAVMLAALAGQTWRLMSLQNEYAQARARWADERAASEGAARKASETYRNMEAGLRAAVKEAEDVGRKERERLVRAASVDRAERNRLRDELSAFAAGSGVAAEDSVDACRTRAATLASAVDDGMRVQAEMASRFASLASDYRTMHSACGAVMLPASQ